MQVAQPSVISSMLRVIWVTSVTPSKSTGEKGRNVSQMAASPPSSVLCSREDQPSTAQNVNAKLTSTSGIHESKAKLSIFSKCHSTRLTRALRPVM